jgi:THO complex subunit 4
MLNYSAGGHSRGVAIVTFVKPGDANKALEKLGSISIDNNRLRVDIIVDAAHAPAPEPAKSFADRVSKPKSDNQKPKPATAAKEGEDKKKAGRGRGRPARGRGGRNTNTRNKPKTAEELDQEMTDYWNGTGADAMATNGGAVQPTAATNGDAGMEDEIMVGA